MWQEAAKPVGYGIAGYLALLLLIQETMEEMSDYCPENVVFIPPKQRVIEQNCHHCGSMQLIQ